MDDVTQLIWLRRLENAWVVLVLSPHILLAIVGWTIEFYISMSLAAVGLFAVALAIAFRQVIPSPIVPGSIITTAPNWLWLFGNDEDGFCSDEARSHCNPKWPDWLNMWWWAAIRNPVGNLRFIKALYPPPQADRICFVQGDAWALTWQGLLYHFAYVGTKRVYAIGWKYYPTDARIDADYGWRKFGCGFAMRRRDRSADDTPDNA